MSWNKSSKRYIYLWVFTSFSLVVLLSVGPLLPFEDFTSVLMSPGQLTFGSEAWVLKKREEQRLEAAQMQFFRHLLGITKLDKEKNQSV